MADEKIARAVLELVIDDKQYKFALDQVKKNSDDTAKHVRGISEAVDVAIFRELGRIGSEALEKIVGGIIELGERGAAVDDMSNSFNTLSRAAGSTGEAMLGELRAGVLGTLSDFDLMQLANKTLGSGLVKNAEDMGTLAAGARALAKATGGTTKDAFDTLTSAMASGRTATLKQIGVFVDAKVATENYAAAHHKTAETMTDADRAQALAGASLQALRDRMKLIVPDAADFGERLDQVKVRLENFRDALAVAVSKSPVLSAGLEAIGRAAAEAFGGKQETAVKTVLDLIERFAIATVRGAEMVVEGARFISNAWSGLTYIFNVVAAAVAETLQGIIRGIADILESAGMIPGIGAQFSAAAAGTRELSDDLGRLSVGYKLNAEAALDGAAKANQAADATKKVLHSIGDAMEAARGKAEPAAKATAEAVAGIGTTALVAKARTDEAANAIAATLRKLQEDITLDAKVGIDKRIAQLEIEKNEAIQKARETKNITAAELAEITTLAEARYQERVAAARLGADEIRDRELQLQQEITLATTTGTAAQLAQIAFKQQQELASIEFLRVNYAAAYNQLAAMIAEKYRLMTDAATGHFATVELAAAAAGFKTRAELEITATRTKQLYEEMLKSGKFTDEELKKSHEAAMKAQQEVDGKVQATRLEQLNIMATSTVTILRSLFGKSKAAAIAATIIETIASAVAAYRRAGGFPWGIPAAAASLAYGYAQVAQIRSQNDGFKFGTPDLDFQDFGRESVSFLHGREAVIPSGSGHMLAAEIAAAMPARGIDDEMAAHLRSMRDGIENLPRAISRAVRDGVLLAGA